MVKPCCSCRRQSSLQVKNWSLNSWCKKEREKNWEKWRSEWGHVFLISDHRLMNRYVGNNYSFRCECFLHSHSVNCLLRNCDLTPQGKTHKRCFGLSESNAGQVSKFTFMSSICIVSCTQNAHQSNNDQLNWARGAKKADRQINQNQKQKLLSDNWLFIWWTFGNDRKRNEPSPRTVDTDEGRWLLHSYVVIVLSVDR